MTSAPANSSTVTELAVTGLNCNNCARKVTGIVQEFKTVASIAVNLDQQRATIRWKPETQAELTTILDALNRAGYSSRVIQEGADESSPMLGGWALNLAVGIPITAMLMLGEWVLPFGGARWFAWTAFGLATVVQVVAGAKFYRGAWAQLKAGSSNMDTLVSLGSTTAFGYSTWALLAGWPEHLYFMEAAAIITLISVGHWIEARVGEKAADSLKALMTLAPQTARKLIRKDTGAAESAPPSTTKHSNWQQTRNVLFPTLGEARREAAQPPPAPVETEVPVAQLRTGDWVALRPGDRIPVDGEVAEGGSAVDESMLTGESSPVDKAAGSLLYAGTRNVNGRLVMRVTATGESTALAHIIAAVQRAQSSRADIQRLGDKVSNVFVPIVCALALGTALWWGFGYDSARAAHDFLGQWLWTAHPAGSSLAAAFIGAAAVLIIACPCAMGLATPAAIMAAANTAARRGILIRDGVALEKAGEVTAVLFDKTGTLTAGELSFAGPWTADTHPDATARARKLTASMARHSNHPISKLLRVLSDEFYELESWREIAGSGVAARFSRPGDVARSVRLGSFAWLAEEGVRIPDDIAQFETWKQEGSSLVGLAADDGLLAAFAIRDWLKPKSADVVAQLKREGLKVFMLSGDSAATANAIGRSAGIEAANIFAQVRPEQKAEFVKRLQSQGERVAFVGDGINDAPALEQADLGIAVSRASDVAREAADIILLKSDIEAVPESLGLARAALRTIKQNLFWAFFYNAAAVPLAVLGFMSPVLCAAAMGVSDIVVIGNALRLRSWKSK